MFTALFVALGLAAPPSEEGWTDMLAGDLAQHWNTKGKWKLDQDGVVEMQRKGTGWQKYEDYLWSKTTYGDFEIVFDCKINTSGRTGFLLRVSDLNDPSHKGIYVMICDTAGVPEEKLTAHMTGAIFPRSAPTKNPFKPAGEWNTFHVTNKADILTVAINGVTVNEINTATIDVRPNKHSSSPKDQAKIGAIGFQDHGRPFWLRNIRIREFAK